jgi:hypothetical protein
MQSAGPLAGRAMMQWLRSKRRTGARLGLFALAVQLVLSFGHIHLQDVAPRSILGAAASHGAWSAWGSSGQRTPGGLPDDDCPICMAVHVAASGLLPMTPMAALPDPFGFALRATIIEKLDVSIPRHILFQTRAPPLA